jgi:HAD superfamily hydrolase (TIGR01549 family)
VARADAVLFDVDDTLFDHRFSTRAALGYVRDLNPCLQAWPAEAFERRNNQLLELYHLEVLAGRLHVDEARRRRFTRLFEEAGESPSQHVLAKALDGYRAAYVAAMRPVPGALALLDALAPYVRLGVVTNNIVDQQVQKVDALGLRPYLSAVVISEAVGFQKPDPRIFWLALEQLECAPGEAVVVGDSWETDISGARAAGIAPVWFNPAGRPQPDETTVPELRAFEPVADAVSVVLYAAHGQDGCGRKER